MENTPTRHLVWDPSHVAPLVTVSGSGNETSISSGFSLDESGKNLLGLPKFKLHDKIPPEVRRGIILSASYSSGSSSSGTYTEMTLIHPKPGDSLGMYRAGDIVNLHPTLSARTIIDAVRYRSTPDLKEQQTWEQVIEQCCTKLDDDRYLVTIRQGASLETMVVGFGSLRVAAVFGVEVVGKWGALYERDCIGNIERIVVELPKIAADIDTALAMIKPL